jgi:hypothetical protein
LWRWEAAAEASVNFCCELFHQFTRAFPKGVDHILVNGTAKRLVLTTNAMFFLLFSDFDYCQRQLNCANIFRIEDWVIRHRRKLIPHVAI